MYFHFKKFLQGNLGQSSIEAALLLPTLLIIIALLVEPICLLYTKSIMNAACSEGLRVAATSSDTQLIESYIRRRLKAVPEVPLFHIGGEHDWSIDIDCNSKTAKIDLKGHASPLPPIGWCLSLIGQTDGRGIVLQSSLSMQTRPEWIEGSYDDWITFWKEGS